MEIILLPKNLKRVLSFALLFCVLSVQAQSKVTDSVRVNELEEVLVSAIRSTQKTPVSFSNVKKEELSSRNLGQDIPILLNFLPSVVTTSDAGNGIGYTGIRVRGSDATRVNVTINGIPYNDSESQGTFWVNMPDFASSVESVQLQRGVGTSTNGAGAFGASLNLATDHYSKESQGEISSSVGSFGTYKNTLKFSTGLLNNNFEMAGRISSINSQGYIDRASSDLKSYFLQGTYVGKSTLIKGLIFGGKEKTYQAWYGVDAHTLVNDRTYNFAGLYTDDDGNIRFYDNQTDNYQQHHFQLHWNEKYSDRWSSNVAAHYTKGNGYYEEYAEDQLFSDYGLQTGSSAETTDLVRRKWLDNDFFGLTSSANYKGDKTEFTFGGSWNKYLGDHYGQVIWTKETTSTPLRKKYYDNTATKIDGTTYLKVNYQMFTDWNFFADLQYRRVQYQAEAIQPLPLNDVFSFLNPKAGVTYTPNSSNAIYFSYARANREPNRTDYENGTPKPERMDDYELGWRFQKSKIKWNANLYWMNYGNQLTLTGELDEVGNPIRRNTENSYRMGLEMEMSCKVFKSVYYQGNITFSRNTIKGEAGQEDKQIAFSPSVVAGNVITFHPYKPIKISWLQKYVGEQYLNNSETAEARLGSYVTHDLNISCEFAPKKVFRSVALSALANNIFDKKYVSNGVDYGGGAIYYYPQAGFNFLAGLTLGF